ncbi:MAG: hypothetical protein QOE92_1805 [Chloroflexota bacterium]|jgi:hypothetical protein|nr:hypothetical protein [Chloroflexota bacterium]
MAETSRSVETSASPGTVWRTWSDPSTWGAWNPDVESASAAGPMAEGVTGRMTTRAGGTHEIHFEAVEDGRAFTLVTRPVPLATFYFRCEISPREDGARLTQSIAMKGPSAFFFRAVATKQIVESFTPILEGLKAKVEAD